MPWYSPVYELRILGLPVLGYPVLGYPAFDMLSTTTLIYPGLAESTNYLGSELLLSSEIHFS